MRERIKKEVAEWEEDANRKEDQSMTNDSEEEEEEAQQSLAPTKPDKKESVPDVMQQQVDESDIKNLGKLVPVELWKYFAMRTLRISPRIVKDIEKESENHAMRVNMAVISWMDGHYGDPSKTTREKLNEQLIKVPQFSEIFKEGESVWVNK